MFGNVKNHEIIEQCGCCSEDSVAPGKRYLEQHGPEGIQELPQPEESWDVSFDIACQEV